MRHLVGVAAVVLLLAASPASAGSTGPPTISDVRTASVSETSAVITASIDPNGLDTSYAVEYGPDGHGSEIAPVDIGAGTAPITITVTLSGRHPAKAASHSKEYQ